MLNVRSIEYAPPGATVIAIDDGVEAARPAIVRRLGAVSILLGATVPPEVALPAICLTAHRALAIDVALRWADKAEALLAEGRADIAFLREPPGDSLISTAVVANEARVALVPRRHALARRAELALDDLRRDEIVEPRVGALGIGPTTAHLEELRARVAGGHAVAVVPEGMLRGSSPAIVAVPLTDAPPSLILLAHRPVLGSAAAVAFVDAALEAARRPQL
jgi:LysR substrate binding domain